MPCWRMIDTGTPCVSSKMAEKRSRRFDSVASGAARVQQRQLEQQPRRLRDLEVAAGRGRQRLHVVFERVENLVRVQLDVLHELAEGVPFDVRERQADVLVRQETMLAPAGIFEGALDHALGRLSQPALWDVEFVLDHGAPRGAGPSKSRAQAPSTGSDEYLRAANGKQAAGKWSRDA